MPSLCATAGTSWSSPNGSPWDGTAGNTALQRPRRHAERDHPAGAGRNRRRQARRIPAGAPLASLLSDPTETKPVESEARTVEKDEDLALLRSVRFIADWPADIHVKPARPESKWSKPAKALRRFEGRIAVIGENMERRAALNLKPADPAWRHQGLHAQGRLPCGGGSPTTGTKVNG